MIYTNIAREYPHQIANCKCSDKTLYLADYTKQTRSARGTEIVEDTAPTDIGCFELKNDSKLRVSYIWFDNQSFLRPDGRNSYPQCECVVFPENSTENSWVFFAELKYCTEKQNDNDIRKAIKQLYLTRFYYKTSGIFSPLNTCYLLVSLPTQSEPFVQYVITPARLLQLKRRHNIVLRLRNNAEIKDNTIINV